MTDKKEIERLAKQMRVQACLDCRKCEEVCPICRDNSEFSPQAFVKLALSPQPERLVSSGLLWACISCGLCRSACPDEQTDFPEFVRGVRETFVKTGQEPPFGHRGMVSAVGRLQASGDLSQKRLSWLTNATKTAESGDVLYFVGCLPYYDVIFSERIKKRLTQIALAGLRLLNSVGITPVVLPNEVCCGSDFYWMGDRQTAQSLFAKNAELIRRSGAKTVVVTCPECGSMLRMYPKLGYDHGCQVHYLADFLRKLIGPVRLAEKTALLSSCRLAPLLAEDLEGLLGSLFKGEVHSLADDLNKPVCCGTGGWLRSDALTRAMQDDLLVAAMNRGYTQLLTVCPKCRVHLGFAMRPEAWRRAELNVEDLTVFLSNNVEKASHGRVQA